MKDVTEQKCWEDSHLYEMRARWTYRVCSYTMRAAVSPVGSFVICLE